MSRTRHRTRAACPLHRVGIECHAFGAEASCGLCSMIDFDHPATCASLGTPGPQPRRVDAEAAFVDHLARVIRTGWRPTRGTAAARVAVTAGLYAPYSDLPASAPF